MTTQEIALLLRVASHARSVSEMRTVAFIQQYMSRAIPGFASMRVGDQVYAKLLNFDYLFAHNYHRGDDPTVVTMIYNAMYA